MEGTQGIRRLEEHLLQVEELLRRLLSTAERLRSCLSRSDTRTLTEVLDAQEEILQRLCRLDAQRPEILEALSRERGGSPVRRLDELLPTLGPSERARLEALRGRCRDLVRGISRLQRVNCLLVEKSRACTEGLGRALLQVLVPTAGYELDGKPRVPDQAIPTVLDREA
jgi:hypothetical protein